MTGFGVESFQTTETPEVKFTTKNKSSLAKFLVAAQSVQAAQGKASGKKSAVKHLASPLSALGRRFFALTEEAITKHLTRGRIGGHVKEGRGGFFPDFFFVDEQGQVRFEEIKQIIARGQVDATGQISITQAREIGLGGGSGITIQRQTAGQTTKLTTGFELEGDELKAQFEEVDTSSFFGVLEKALTLPPSQRQELIIERLKNPGSDRAALFYSKSLATKANAINVPVIVGDKIYNRKLVFTLDDLFKGARSGLGQFEVKKDGQNIKFNYKFKRKSIEKLLADMSVGSLETIEVNMDKVLNDLLAFTRGVVADTKGVKEFLKALDLEVALEFLEGSAIMFQGTITKRKEKRSDKQSITQKFLSAAQLTSLTQRRLAQIMPRGPERGPPLSPNVLTERTGRFRTSVSVIPNYRNNLVRFFYDPIYKTFINSPRNPDVFITQAIREIVLQQYKRQFKIVRGA